MDTYRQYPRNLIGVTTALVIVMAILGCSDGDARFDGGPGAAISGRFQQTQLDPSILSLLPVKGALTLPSQESDRDTTIAAGLTENDFLVRNGRRVAAWTISLQVGNEIQIDLESTAFDSYLYLVAPGTQSVSEGQGEDAHVLTDDDGGEGYNARLCLTVARSGEYRIVVGALNEGSGDYHLHLRPVCGSESEYEVGLRPDFRYLDAMNVAASTDRSLDIGYEVEGELTSADTLVDGRHLQVWSLVASEEDPIVVALESEDFDAYIIAYSPSGTPTSDDDGGSGTNARVVLTASNVGTWRIVVTSFDGGTGSFRLRALRLSRQVLS